MNATYTLDGLLLAILRYGRNSRKTEKIMNQARVAAQFP